MIKALYVSVIIASVILPCIGQEPAGSPFPAVGNSQDFVMEQPGTITFKHGVVIVGKVEKPQVMIFISKEKSFYREIKFLRSFRDDILEPMPFVPVIE